MEKNTISSFLKSTREIIHEVGPLIADLKLLLIEVAGFILLFYYVVAKVGHN